MLSELQVVDISKIVFKQINFVCRYFMYDGLKHSCVEGNHIVNVFSFSKAYGMMGWRVGYVSAACCLYLVSSAGERNIILYSLDDHL